MKKPVGYYSGHRSDMLPFVPSEYRRVLEVGCAEGEFSRQLSGAVEKWGCELDPDAASKALTNLTKVLIGKYNQVADELPDAYFDLVICNDVIEHMEDHDWFFDSIRKKMAPEGILIGSIPNVRHVRNLYNLLVRKDWEYTDNLTLDRTHLRWFTGKSLLRTFARHRFEVIKFQGRNGTKSALLKMVLGIFNLFTLRRHADIEYLTYGFQLRKK